jgi:DNA-binding LacI/PurR family transcriptional regulator
MNSTGFHVTLQQVADEAKVSRAAASMALRQHPRISLATREHVAIVARRLGYRPDPGLQALAAYRSRKITNHKREVIIFLKIVQPEVHPIEKSLEEGIRERIQELGYIFDIAETKATSEELSRLARSLSFRGIRGIVVNAGRLQSEKLPMAWEKFHAIQVSGHPSCNFLPGISADAYKGVVLAIEKLAEKGYRRPGLWLHWVSRQYTEEYIAGGFRQACLAMYGSEDFPIYRAPEVVVPLAPAMSEWARKNDIDVIIDAGMGSIWREIKSLRGRKSWKGGGLGLDVFPESYPNVAGIVQPRRAIGRAAVDQLHAYLIINQPGVMKFPPLISILGTWRDAPSLPMRTRL